MHYLVKYKLSKIATTEARQPKNERARTKENVIMVDELVLSEQDQPQCSDAFKVWWNFLITFL